MPTVAQLAGEVSLDVRPFTAALDIARRAFSSFIDIGFAAEKALNSFQVVTRASAEQMKLVSDVAERLGADLTLPATSAADAASAMTELAKAGFSAQQAMDTAKGVLQLAAAAQIEEAKAAEIAAGALHTFHLSASESGRVADLLAAAANASSASITDLSQGMQQAGFIFADTKQPIDTLITSLAALTNVGLTGSDAGTALKNAFTRMINPTKEASAVMQKLGIDFFDANKQMKPLPDIIENLQKATANLTDKQRTAALSTIFLSDGYKAISPLITLGAEGFQKLSEEVNRSGAAAELAAGMTKGLSGAWEGLQSQMETVALKAFNAVKDGLTDIVQSASEVVAGFGKLDAATIKMLATFAGAVTAGGSLTLFSTGLLQLGPKGAVVLAVIAGAAAMAAAYSTNFGQMEKALDSFVNNVARSLGATEQHYTSWEKVTHKAGVVFAGMVDLVVTGVSQVVEAVSTGAKALIALYTFQWDEINDINRRGAERILQIGAEFMERSRLRNLEFQAIERGGWQEHMALLARINSEGGYDAGKGFTDAYQAAVKSGSQSPLTDALQQQFGAATLAARLLGEQAGQETAKGYKETVKKEEV